MQIVIEISSYDKEWITNGYYIPEEINMRISEAIANGTPLPKGHGDLIDREQVLTSLFAYVTWKKTIGDCVNKVKAVIPADKEDAE